MSHKVSKKVRQAYRREIRSFLKPRPAYLPLWLWWRLINLILK